MQEDANTERRAILHLLENPPAAEQGQHGDDARILDQS